MPQWGAVSASLTPAELASLPENTALMANLIGRFSSRVDFQGDEAGTQKVFELLQSAAAQRESHPDIHTDWTHPLGMIDTDTFVAGVTQGRDAFGGE